jgi:hypothetical protein
VSAAAVLRRLQDAGVEVAFQAPDNIRLHGPLTPELVELARAAKPELLALARPTVQPAPCACCGRFFFAEPATVCFWCRPRKHIDEIDETRADTGDVAGSVNSVNVCAAPCAKRECPSCGGGKGRDDDGGGLCWSCRHVAGGGAP